MGISEKKMKIVIENYFKAKCNINTTIHDAFEKGFRIGVQKGISSERKRGQWIPMDDTDFGVYFNCSVCDYQISDRYGKYNYCPNCGSDNRGKQDE